MTVEELKEKLADAPDNYECVIGNEEMILDGVEIDNTHEQVFLNY